MITRRDAAKAATITALSYSRVLGANDRVGLGVIGTGERGTYVMTLFQKNPEVEVRALCDVYPKRIDEAQQKAPNTKTFADHRQLLELKEIDAVLVGSPDHWHRDHAVDAMNAGKDVYVEKPMCRTLDEAPDMVRAARVNERICQVGLQQRSGRSISSRGRSSSRRVLSARSRISMLFGTAAPQSRSPRSRPKSHLTWTGSVSSAGSSTATGRPASI
jgi:hypothetical protein